MSFFNKRKKKEGVPTMANVLYIKIDDQEWYPLFKNSQPNILFVLFSKKQTSDEYIERYWHLNPPGVDSKIFAREKNKLAMKNSSLIKK